MALVTHDSNYLQLDTALGARGSRSSKRVVGKKENSEDAWQGGPPKTNSERIIMVMKNACT